MKIALTGAGSTGKTTLLNGLKQDPWVSGLFEFQGSITRDVAAMGLPINENGSVLTQTVILAKHIQHAHTDKHLVLDRCVIDGMVYTEYLWKSAPFPTKPGFAELVDLYRSLTPELTSKYDIVFYTTPEFEPVADGQRSVDQTFRDDIIEIFNWHLVNLKGTTKIIPLSGNPQQRLDLAVEVIKNHFINLI